MRSVDKLARGSDYLEVIKSPRSKPRVKSALALSKSRAKQYIREIYHMAGGRSTAEIKKNSTHTYEYICGCFFRFEQTIFVHKVYRNTRTHRAIVQPSKSKLRFLLLCAQKSAHGTICKLVYMGSRSNSKMWSSFFPCLRTSKNCTHKFQL
jgi:hypothetical protein